MKILTVITQTLVVSAALALIGCGSTPPATPAAEAGAAGASGGSGASGPIAIKTYPMHGKIISLTPPDTARIEAGALGDWMGPMTMNYTIKDPAGYAKLTAGGAFDATVYVQGDDFWVGDVKPAAK